MNPVSKQILCAIAIIIVSYTGGLLSGLTIAEKQQLRYVENSSRIDTTKLSPWQVLQMAIVKTESDFNPLATGSSGDVGIFQETKIYVKDVCRISGKEYLHEDAFSPSKAIEMFNIFQSHYNPNKDIHKAIKLHNPKGHCIDYAKRVLKNIEYIERYENVRSLVIQTE